MNHFTTTFNRYKWPLLLFVVVLMLPANLAVASGVQGFFYEVIQTLFGYIVIAGAMVLNYGLNEFVIGFGQRFATSGVGDAIDSLWSTVRDLFNLTFIFGLVYIGFKMILRTDDGQTRRWLVQLIIAALLVNFSLFITKFVVDASNILAVEIMNLDSTIFPPHSDPSRGFGPGAPGVDLSRSMQQATGIVTINNTTGALVTAELSGRGWSFIFGMMFLYLITAFVYFSAGILLIIRGIVLWVLMIISPFLFLGMVLPFFKSFSSNLWSTLFKRAFLAPIYVLLLYLSMSLANALLASGGGDIDFSGALVPPDGALAVDTMTETFGAFIIVIALLLGSLTAARKLGAEGASTVMKMGQNLRQRGQRMVTQGARWTGRQAVTQTAGRGARYASEKAGRSVSRGLQNLQQVEGSGVIAKATRSVARSNAVQGTVGAGAAAMQQTKFGLKRTLEQEQQIRNQTERASNQAMAQNENLRILEDANSNSQQLNDAMNELASTIRKMSGVELANMSTDKLTNKNVALNISDGQIASLEKSDKFSADQIQQIKDSRKQAQISVAQTGFANRELAEKTTMEPADKSVYAQQQQANLMQKSDKEVGSLPVEIFMEEGMADFIKPQALEERMKNGGISNDQLVKIQTNLQSGINKKIKTGNEQITKVWEKWAENSIYGSQLNLKFDSIDNSPQQPPSPQIVLGTSQEDLQRAREYRDSQNR